MITRLKFCFLPILQSLEIKTNFLFIHLLKFKLSFLFHDIIIFKNNQISLCIKNNTFFIIYENEIHFLSIIINYLIKILLFNCIIFSTNVSFSASINEDFSIEDFINRYNEALKSLDSPFAHLHEATTEKNVITAYNEFYTALNTHTDPFDNYSINILAIQLKFFEINIALFKEAFNGLSVQINNNEEFNSLNQNIDNIIANFKKQYPNLPELGETVVNSLQENSDTIDWKIIFQEIDLYNDGPRLYENIPSDGNSSDEESKQIDSKSKKKLLQNNSTCNEQGFKRKHSDSDDDNNDFSNNFKRQHKIETHSILSNQLTIRK